MRSFRLLSFLIPFLWVSVTSFSLLPLLAAQANEEGNRKAKMVTLHTNHGDIVITLFPKEAPLTVENFLRYSREGHYDNTLFHRVIRNFMIQGGGLEPRMEEKPTHETIKNEADNGISNRVGTLAMARTDDPHSASAQFFINVADNTRLDHSAPTPDGWGYCVFGMVSDGMEVVNSIRVVPTTSRDGQDDVPEEDVIIKSVTVTEGE